ncbi:MAG: hypothetical protein ACLQVN_05810 [Bryobacteraceae bacterium]
MDLLRRWYIFGAVVWIGCAGIAGAQTQPAEKPVEMRPRLHRLLLRIMGPEPLAGEALSAGIGQSLNSPREWGQGASGYAARFGNDMGYNAVRQGMTFGLAALFHEDTRYIRSTKHGVMPRAAHAVASVFNTRSQGGDHVFYAANFLGIVGASAISQAWAPPSWHDPATAGRKMTFSLLGSMGLNLAREFLPDLAGHRRQP